MSRVLAQLLGAEEPAFHLRLRQLERLAGLPSADIRLAVHIAQATKSKMAELGLDPADTTGPELFAALQTRLREDEVRLRAALNLRADIQPADILEKLVQQLNTLEHPSRLMVVKTAVIKRILKKLKPKATMKRLGYRSMDSMLKHEPVVQLLAACQVTESTDWQKSRYKAYASLQPRDFEYRAPHIVVPTTKQWPQLAETQISERKTHLLSVPEVGGVVVLPMVRDLPGLAVTTSVLAVHILNEQRVLSAYLKLLQVQPDFGALFSEALTVEPMTGAELAGHTLSWRIVHWLYGQEHVAYQPDVFEPHVQLEDLQWHDVGDVLASLQPLLSFWKDTELLGMVDGTDTVSLNVLDVALSFCNGLHYSERVLHTMREALGRELCARYARPDTVQQALHASLGAQLMPELGVE